MGPEGNHFQRGKGRLTGTEGGDNNSKGRQKILSTWGSNTGLQEIKAKKFSFWKGWVPNYLWEGES